MALRSNSAFEGDAEMPNGRRVTVFFMCRKDIKREWGDSPLVTTRKRRVGWYWRHDDDMSPRRTAGPFTSSRRAMLDALAQNLAPTESDHV